MADVGTDAGNVTCSIHLLVSKYSSAPNIIPLLLYSIIVIIIYLVPRRFISFYLTIVNHVRLITDRLSNKNKNWMHKNKLDSTVHLLLQTCFFRYRYFLRMHNKDPLVKFSCYPSVFTQVYFLSQFPYNSCTSIYYRDYIILKYFSFE